MEVIQLVLVERIKDGVSDQTVDILVPPVMKGFVATVQEAMRVDPTGTSATTDRRVFCGCARSSGS